MECLIFPNSEIAFYLIHKETGEAWCSWYLLSPCSYSFIIRGQRYEAVEDFSSCSFSLYSIINTAAIEHTSGWSYGFSSADGCLHVFICESLCMSFCNGSYFHFRSVCLWWQTAINGSTRCRHKKPSRSISHHNIPTSFPLDSNVSLLQDTNPVFPHKLS